MAFEEENETDIPCLNVLNNSKSVYLFFPTDKIFFVLKFVVSMLEIDFEIVRNKHSECGNGWVAAGLCRSLWPSPVYCHSHAWPRHGTNCSIKFNFGKNCFFVPLSHFSWSIKCKMFCPQR